MTSVCHQGRGDGDDACDVDPEALDPDAAGAIGALENFLGGQEVLSMWF